jgi:hypothetical protein
LFAPPDTYYIGRAPQKVKIKEERSDIKKPTIGILQIKGLTHHGQTLKTLITLHITLICGVLILEFKYRHSIRCERICDGKFFAVRRKFLRLI